MAKDYYKILGLKRTASEDEIKKVYRKLARKYHPDVNPGDASSEEKFKSISEAYHVLGDPEKRKQYDQFGSDVFSGNQQGGNPFAGFDFSQFERGGGSGGGSFRDFFSDIFSQSPQEESRVPRKGADTHHSIEISFLDASRGISTRLNLQGHENCQNCNGTGQSWGGKNEVCPVCHGAGEVTMTKGPLRFQQPCDRCRGSGNVNATPCQFCHGRGMVPKSSNITVKIPPGVDTGSRIRVAGKGAPGRHGGPPGDLFITVRVAPHSYFKRSGKNLLLDIPISISEALLGARILIPTLESKVKMTIPPGTSGNRVFRLTGKGFPDLKKGKPGDLMVTVHIESPGNIPEKAKDLIREFERINPHNPRERMFTFE